MLALTASLGTAIAVLPAAASGAAAATSADSSQCPWVTSTAPISQRVNMLLSVMTVQQMDDLVYGNGSYSSGYVGHIPAIPSLCIPALNLEDGPEGVADGVTGVTQLPAAVSAVATWDRSAIEQYGTVIGSEEAGKGANVNLGPTVNIVRDPRWGRAFESYGEDPYLSGQAAVADITGVQSQGVMSMVKHWDVYNQETNRNTPQDDAIVSDRTMHEIYMPQFQAAVQQGRAAAVMCSYSTINGTYACENSYIDNVMDNEFGFQGYITSDWGATHSTVPSALAGLDMQMPDSSYYSTPLVQAVQDGQVPLAALKEMARRILGEMFRFGLFNKPATGSPSAVVTSPAHAAVARQVAEEGTVLLKNEGGLLPLNTRKVHSIAVIGDDAGSGAMSSGGGSASVVAPYVVTPYQGIAARAGSNATVSYAPSDITQAVALAKQSDVAIVFAGYEEHEGADLTSIDLAASDNQLISAVAAANPNTIVVLNTGSAVTMPWLSAVKGVFEAWYPGQEDGNAIAALLFGDVNPSGKLPVTFPKSLADVPASTPQQWPGVNGQVDYSEGLLVGYRWYDAKNIQPLFPFGYGLSYTSFRFSNLIVTPHGPNGDVTVHVNVTNTGKAAGAETVQAYVGDPAPTGEPPEQLKGFQKVELRPGQTAQVRIQLDRSAFAYWNSTTSAWSVAPGWYKIVVGDSSASLPLQASLHIAG